MAVVDYVPTGILTPPLPKVGNRTYFVKALRVVVVGGESSTSEQREYIRNRPQDQFALDGYWFFAVEARITTQEPK